LWAKTDQTGGEKIHPLIYHLIDVGECTLALWNHALSEQTRQTFAGFLNLDDEATGRLLAFWSSLHDLGKAAPGFQRKHTPAIYRLKDAGFVFPEASPKSAPHGQVSAWSLETLLVRELDYSQQISKKVSRAIGGHHGSWPSVRELQSLDRQVADTGDNSWDAARVELLNVVKVIFDPPTTYCVSLNIQEENALFTLFSGLVSVADWIGSMSEYFAFETQYYTAQEYARRSAQLAEKALHCLGWIGWQAVGQLHSFTQMFPSFSPRDAQQAVFDVTENIKQPAMIILEAPTGSGKTETALFLADTWLQTNRGHGIYIAMPTQATSNQMFARVYDFLTKCYPEEMINYHLVHGGALLAENNLEPNMVDIADEESSPHAGGIRAQGWFLPRKRTLLASFGVGTVDQALLSVLQTRHFFVRLFGLGQKVIVFDEVHAYDTYMSNLFERLLAWLQTIGTSVILLSATLPEDTRRKLAAAWLGKKHVDLPQTEYPRLTLVSGEQIRTINLPASESRTLALEWVNGEPQNIATHLADRLQDGGCAAIICNRIARAQEIYKTIKTAGIVDPENLFLFHARFPFAWRENIEKQVLNLFSKDKENPDQRNSNRPQKAIIVSTQVIEQSLDLDFDYMISDLAPVDLLIQRAGRLHRHCINDDTRPATLKNPLMAISQSVQKENIPDFGLDEFVYERAVLLRTWLVLNERSEISLPREISELIETVYAKLPILRDPKMIQALSLAEEKAHKEYIKEIVEAKKRLIPSPDDEELLYVLNEGLEEEDPKIHHAFRALTRLVEQNVSLICIHKFGNSLTLEPKGEGTKVDLFRTPNRQQTRELLQHVINVQNRNVVNYFVNQGEHLAWNKIAALRYHYPLVFNENGFCHLDGTSLTLFLSRETGLEIRKEAA